MTASLDAAVDSDITELTDSLRNGGMRALAATISGRVREDRNGPMYYRLANPADGIEAGNLPWTAHRLGRFDVGLASADTGRDNALRLRARGLDLPGGAYLLVGIDAHPLDEMHELILRAFGWGSAITLVLAFGGGALLSGSLLRRVEAIARAARDIMSDDFSLRLPTRGTDDEFDHLVTSLNAMLDQTQAAVARVRQVSDDIAHDLRTPLTRLRQHLEQAQHRARSVADWRDAATACI